jgi:hypothetical protein
LCIFNVQLVESLNFNLLPIIGSSIV